MIIVSWFNWSQLSDKLKIPSETLKDSSQPPAFSMPSKLLILQGAAKSYCFIVSCVPEKTTSSQGMMLFMSIN